jgi:hypothetical protein
MGQANIISWVACYTTLQTMVVMNSMIAANGVTNGHTQHPKTTTAVTAATTVMMPAARNTAATMMSGTADITIENVHAVKVVAAYTHDDDAVESYERKRRLRSDER